MDALCMHRLPGDSGRPKPDAELQLIEENVEGVNSST